MSAPPLAAPRPPHPHLPALMLLAATAAWSLSFSLAKDAGSRLNDLSALGHGAFFGPTALQGVRFTLAALLWFLLVPPARRGWTPRGAFRGLYSGLLLALGILLQHLALDRTSPAATAFLTSLTVFWIPLLAVFTTRRLPPRPLLAAAALATAGLYLLLGEGLTSFRTGEMLGLACSLVFAFYLLAVSRVSHEESPWRMCGAQFAVAGLACLLPALLQSGVSPLALARYTLDPGVLPRLAALLALPTFLAFGLMNLYQPRVDPTRAALIYTAEPVLAALFDLALTGRALTPLETTGAALILTANLAAELLPHRTPTPTP